jgi:hypothetical protein
MEHRHGGFSCGDHTTDFHIGERGRDEGTGIDRVDGSEQDRAGVEAKTFESMGQ